MIVVVAVTWVFLSFHLLFCFACIQCFAIGNKTMRDDGKQWRSFTMRSVHTYYYYVHVCWVFVIIIFTFPQDQVPKLFIVMLEEYSNKKSFNFGTKMVLNAHINFPSIFITICLSLCMLKLQKLISYTQKIFEHQNAMAFPCSFFQHFDRIYGILNTANGPS